MGKYSKEDIFRIVEEEDVEEEDMEEEDCCLYLLPFHTVRVIKTRGCW